MDFLFTIGVPMTKLKLHTPDLVSANIEKIANLFPNVITETWDENGVLRKAINFDKLKQELASDVIDGEESYDFTWVGKKASIVESSTPIQKTLRPCIEDSKDWEKTKNLYIEGDNLEVLKLLQESYLNKIKMIYIDPPYNTGKDFIYDDNFVREVSEYDEDAGVVDESGNRLFMNTESNGRFHSDWCSMIFARLKLARGLLTDDGVIFISIDDHEFFNLRKICDQVFGEGNFVGTLVLQTATDNNPSQINIEHEYVLCYSKNKNVLDYWKADNDKAELINLKYLELKDRLSDISMIQTELRKWIRENKEALSGVTHYDNVDEKGVFHDGDVANTVFGEYVYDVIHPVTQKKCKIPEKGFRFPKETMDEMIRNNEILFGVDETVLIKPKKRIEKSKDVLRSVIYEDGRTSTKKFETLMGRDIFQNPKSETIIQRFINFIVKDSDIVLDFFSGSGTTGESVLLHNAQKKANVKFILVQLPDSLDESLVKADSKNKKTILNAIKFLDGIGKKHILTEIGKERIRRAGEKIKAELTAKTEGTLDFSESGTIKPDDLDIGFRVFKVDSSNMKDVYYAAGDYTQNQLDLFESNIKEDRTPLDLLYQCMLDWGVELSLTHSMETIDGVTVHTVDKGALVACFDGKVPESVVREIAKRKPLRVVFRDSSFADSQGKINVTEIFKTLSGETSVRVI
jgi:adenine-specific DNA-methyltransferase